MMPVVSPDNRYIVYVNSQSRTPNLMRMELDGSNVKQLTKDMGAVNPTISPDGQWVAYISYNGTRQAIFKVSIDGGPSVQVAEASYVRAEYSPDGKWLACIVNTPETGSKKLVVIPANGGAPIKTFEKTPFQRWGYLHWLPDSRAFTLSGAVNNASNIYKYSLDGDAPQPLTNFKSDWIFRYAWSRDGKLLAVERGMPVNDVILISDLK